MYIASITLLVFATALSATSTEKGTFVDNGLRKSYYVQTSDEGKFRNNARNFIEIDSATVLVDQKPNEKAEIWNEIHKSISKLDRRSSIHVRFYFAKRDRGMDFDELKKAVKQKLADIDIYVSCVDGQYRNDGKSWADYVAGQVRLATAPPLRTHQTVCDMHQSAHAQ